MGLKVRRSGVVVNREVVFKFFPLTHKFNFTQVVAPHTLSLSPFDKFLSFVFCQPPYYKSGAICSNYLKGFRRHVPFPPLICVGGRRGVLHQLQIILVLLIQGACDLPGPMQGADELLFGPELTRWRMLALKEDGEKEKGFCVL
ncbi:hypothetical protein CDAR_320971 [Caerostris darwini]|uniref:Uncharacterized protein n=1 Tax=Caerostris darwini TaxID=1538125 RepID=A0AAV4WYB9_9ARAC|nr:hypothetical protein CDAR_320971 [Caerostris darwini]